MIAAPTLATPRPRRSRRAAALLLASLGACGAAGAGAPESGVLQVRSAATVQVAGTWYLSARVECRLGSAQVEALGKGVPLRVRIEAELDRIRAWWPDAAAARVARDSELVYQPLTEQYVVRDVAADERQSFNSLSAALEAIGEVRRIALVEDRALDQDARYVGRVRAVLDPEGLSLTRPFLGVPRPGPALVSDWYPWSLQR